MKIAGALLKFTQRHPVRAKKLVAVSGGRDSVVLLHALYSAGHHNLVVCHLNHRLRGRASAGDAAFVKRLAAKLGLPFEVATTDVKREAKSSGDSLETAGRRARHRFFAECARQHRCRLVLMAHHAGDQVETVLYNLFRGASGLRGMEGETLIRVPGERSPLLVARPLLHVTREEIDAWLKAHGVSFREDESNQELDPVRNRIRHRLLPEICSLMGRDVRPALLRAAAIAADESSFLAELAAPPGRAVELDVREMTSLHVALQRRIIHLWLQEKGVPGVGFQEVESVRSMLDSATGPPAVNLPGNNFARRRKGKLRMERPCGRRITRPRSP